MFEKWCALGRHVIAVAVHVQWFRGCHAISKASVTIEDVEVQPNMRTTPSWRFLPREWEQQFTNLERAARLCVTRWSVSGFGKGAVLIPIGKLSAVYEELVSLREQFQAVTIKFIAAYPSIVQHLRETLSSAEFADLEKRLPTVAALRTKFSLRWVTIPIGTGVTPELVERLRELVTMAEEHDVPDVVDQAQSILDQLESSLETSNKAVSEELVAHTRESIDELVSDMVESICAEPRQQIAEACDALLKGMKNGAVQGRTLRNVREAFEKFEAFSFMADADLMIQLRICSQAVGAADHRTLNSNSEVQAALSQAINSLCTNLTDTLERSKNLCEVVV